MASMPPGCKSVPQTRMPSFLTSGFLDGLKYAEAVVVVGRVDAV
jgi:hypothetical protein